MVAHLLDVDIHDDPMNAGRAGMRAVSMPRKQTCEDTPMPTVRRREIVKR
jgi:hypothetical protein